MDFVSKSPIACGRAASLAFRLPWTRLLSLSSHRGPVASWKIWLSWYLPHTFPGQLDFSWISYFYWKIWILVLMTLEFVLCVVVWFILKVRCPCLPVCPLWIIFTSWHAIHAAELWFSCWWCCSGVCWGRCLKGLLCISLIKWAVSCSIHAGVPSDCNGSWSREWGWDFAHSMWFSLSNGIGRDVFKLERRVW